MVDEKGLEAEAADRIGEWVQMSGGEDLVEKLLGMHGKIKTQNLVLFISLENSHVFIDHRKQAC